MAIYARLENGTYAEVTGVYKADGTEVTEIFQGDRLVYSASSEIYGSLPLYYNGRGYDLTDYLISGNTVQDGTPSADAPVDATGSGVGTGNLFDLRATDTNNGFVDSGYLYDDGRVSTSSQYFVSEYIQVQPGTKYTLFYGNTVNAPSVCFYDSTKTFISGERYGGRNPVTFTTPQETAFVRFSGVDSQRSITMLNLGSTALPYEPYGYKLPLTVNGTEYPIYLGQVESTRRIKKLVLTGSEVWGKDANFDELDDYFYTDPISGLMRTSSAISSHFISGSRGVVDSVWIGGSASTPRIAVEISKLYTGITSADDKAARVAKFKSYLAAQYQNGTPVTVWYVLAEPETGIVNESLMKIGEYADTVSFAQAGVTLPTVSGENVLDMTSPVKPSEVYIKGKGIKPTGYGQLTDANGVNILDKDGKPIYVHGQ